MHPEMKYDDDLLDTGDDLGPLLDLKFILLIALIVVLTYFAQKQLDNRFAIPAGPGSGLITLGEQDYQRMVVVSVDAGGTLQVNGEEIAEDRLADRLQKNWHWRNRLTVRMRMWSSTPIQTCRMEKPNGCT